MDVARGRAGECLLRIENTDTSREVAESVAQIERSLGWHMAEDSGRGWRYVVPSPAPRRQVRPRETISTQSPHAHFK